MLIIEVSILRSFYLRIKIEEPNMYFTLSELRSRRVELYYFRYIVFRLLPIIIVCLLNYKIALSFFDSNIYILRFNVILVVMELILTNIKSAIQFIETNLSMQHLIISLLIFSTPFVIDRFTTEIVYVLPSTQGLIDNIWTGILIYGVISLLNAIFKMDKCNDLNPIDSLDKQILENKIKKYKHFIEIECWKYNADSNLVKSVAIYESMQRPIIFRIIEYIFVFITKIPTTQGIMQFNSNKIISDKESIKLSIEKYFVDTNKQDEIYTILYRYNPSSQYIEDVNSIYNKIRGHKM